MQPVQHSDVPQIVIRPEKGENEANKTSSAAAENAGSGLWGSDGFTFADILDCINPLQHIPIISTLYRALTHDEIGIAPRLVGGVALGGLVGLGVAAADAAVLAVTGKDTGETVLAAAGVTGNGNTENNPAGNVENYARIQRYQQIQTASMESAYDAENPWA